MPADSCTVPCQDSPAGPHMRMPLVQILTWDQPRGAMLQIKGQGEHWSQTVLGLKPPSVPYWAFLGATSPLPTCFLICNSKMMLPTLKVVRNITLHKSGPEVLRSQQSSEIQTTSNIAVLTFGIRNTDVSGNLLNSTKMNQPWRTGRQKRWEGVLQGSFSLLRCSIEPSLMCGSWSP